MDKLTNSSQDWPLQMHIDANLYRLVAEDTESGDLASRQHFIQHGIKQSNITAGIPKVAKTGAKKKKT